MVTRLEPEMLRMLTYAGAQSNLVQHNPSEIHHRLLERTPHLESWGTAWHGAAICFRPAEPHASTRYDCALREAFALMAKVLEWSTSSPSSHLAPHQKRGLCNGCLKVPALNRKSGQLKLINYRSGYSN